MDGQQNHGRLQFHGSLLDWIQARSAHGQWGVQTEQSDAFQDQLLSSA
jgi:hypothetical protein